MGSEITPMLESKVFIMPVLLNILNAMEYTRTQLMKFGSVVTVCTTLRNGTQRSSFINTANSIGSQEVPSEMPLMTKVFRSTWPIC